MDEPKLLRVPEVARIFNVSRPTVYRMVKSGELEAFTISGSIRIPAEAVSRYLESHRVDPDSLEIPSDEEAREMEPGASEKPKDTSATGGAYVSDGDRPARQAGGDARSTIPTEEMLLERKAWRIARQVAVKLVPAGASDQEWESALKKAYVEARKRVKLGKEDRIE